MRYLPIRKEYNVTVSVEVYRPYEDDVEYLVVRHESAVSTEAASRTVMSREQATIRHAYPDRKGYVINIVDITEAVDETPYTS